MIAAHPERARKLVPLLDRGKAEPGEFAEEVSEEDLEGYVPLQQRENLDKILRDLQTLGFAAVVDDD